jgi:hypothetical protein
VVVAVFVEVIPEVKRRQIKQAVDAYEAMRRKHASRKRETTVIDKSPASSVKRKPNQKAKRNRSQKAE